MRRRASRPRRARNETDQFRVALMRLRKEKKWTQDDLALVLRVSKRTICNWENGYWLPPFKQRLHVVVALNTMPPEHVLEIADGLGVTTDPAVAPLLQPHWDALDALEDDSPPAPPPAPPRPRPSPEAVRSAVDPILRDAADGMNVLANDLRTTIGRALAACAELGGTLEDARDAVVVKGKRA